ncbi:hypothetical protein FKM82_024447 [Ascaphus truei]
MLQRLCVHDTGATVLAHSVSVARPTEPMALFVWRLHVGFGNAQVFGMWRCYTHTARGSLRITSPVTLLQKCLRAGGSHGDQHCRGLFSRAPLCASLTPGLLLEMNTDIHYRDGEVTVYRGTSQSWDNDRRIEGVQQRGGHRYSSEAGTQRGSGHTSCMTLGHSIQYTHCRAMSV